MFKEYNSPHLSSSLVILYSRGWKGMNSPTANDWPVIDAFLARDMYRSAVSSISACCQVSQDSFSFPQLRHYTNYSFQWSLIDVVLHKVFRELATLFVHSSQSSILKQHFQDRACLPIQSTTIQDRRHSLELSALVIWRDTSSGALLQCGCQPEPNSLNDNEQKTHKRLL